MVVGAVVSTWVVVVDVVTGLVVVWVVVIADVVVVILVVVTAVVVGVLVSELSELLSLLQEKAINTTNPKVQSKTAAAIIILFSFIMIPPCKLSISK